MRSPHDVETRLVLSLLLTPLLTMIVRAETAAAEAQPSRPGTSASQAASTEAGTSTAATPAPAALQEPEAAKDEGGPLRLADRLTFYGDFRYRHEDSFELDDQPSRNRERIRLRFGLDVKVTEEVVAGARLRSGNPEDPKSPHQTLGDGFDSFELNLDRAYVTYRPKKVDGLWATGGKFGNPFAANPIYGELVWDGDVQPEGVAAGISFKDLAAVERLDFTFGESILLEQSARDSEMFAGQAALRVRLAEKTTLQAAACLYHYGDITPSDSTALLADNAGNAVVTAPRDPNDPNSTLIPVDYLSEFDVWNGLLSVTFGRWRLPLTWSAEYVVNSSAEIDADRGWATAVALGKTAAARDWQVYFQYQKIEQDAVYTPVAQDDFLFTTNHRSHVGGFRYQVWRAFEVHAWALVSRRDEVLPGASPTADSTDYQWRARLDLNARF